MLNIFTVFRRRISGHRFLGRKARHISEIPLQANRPYLVKGLLLPKQVSIMAAPPNTGKSCLVAALLAKLTQGKAFAGHKVRRSAALYVGAEDPDGIAIRADGHYATAEDKDTSEFLVFDQAVDMSNRYDIERFIEDVRAFKKKVTANRLIIVFDTLTLSIGNSDENNAGDMTKVMANARELAQKTGAHVMLIHHTSAADPRKARGSTALVGNPDTILLLKEVSKNRVLMEAFKQRSMQKGDDTAWEIKVMDFGVDDDGDMVTNPVAEWVEDASDWTSSTPKPKGKKASHSRADEVLRTLLQLESAAPANGAPVLFSSKQIADHVGAPFNRESMKPDSLQKAVRDALNALVVDGRVERLGSQGYRTSPTHGPRKDDSAEYATLH